MKVSMNFDFTNCHDCPHSGIDRGHGYTAVRCCHTQWEAETSKNTIPWDCPLLENNKGKTKEYIEAEYAKRGQEKKDAWLEPFKSGFSKVGAEFVDLKIISEGYFERVEFFIKGGEPNDIASVLYKNLIVSVGTEGKEFGYFEGIKYKFSRC